MHRALQQGQCGGAGLPLLYCTSCAGASMLHWPAQAAVLETPSSAAPQLRVSPEECRFEVVGSVRHFGSLVTKQLRLLEAGLRLISSRARETGRQILADRALEIHKAGGPLGWHGQHGVRRHPLQCLALPLATLATDHGCQPWCINRCRQRCRAPVAVVPSSGCEPNTAFETGFKSYRSANASAAQHILIQGQVHDESPAQLMQGLERSPTNLRFLLLCQWPNMPLFAAEATLCIFIGTRRRSVRPRPGCTFVCTSRRLKASDTPSRIVALAKARLQPCSGSRCSVAQHLEQSAHPIHQPSSQPPTGKPGIGQLPHTAWCRQRLCQPAAAAASVPQQLLSPTTAGSRQRQRRPSREPPWTALLRAVEVRGGHDASSRHLSWFAGCWRRPSQAAVYHTRNGLNMTPT